MEDDQNTNELYQELKENRREFRRISRKMLREIQKLEKQEAAQKQNVLDLLKDGQKELAKQVFQEYQKLKQRITDHCNLRAKVVVMEMQLSSQMANQKIKETTLASQKFLEVAREASSPSEANILLKDLIQKFDSNFQIMNQNLEGGAQFQNLDEKGPEMEDQAYMSFLKKNGIFEALPDAPQNEVAMKEKQKEIKEKEDKEENLKRVAII